MSEHEHLHTIDDVRTRLEGSRFVMVTSIDERGTLSSRPVTMQRFEASGDLWFLVDGTAEWVRPLDGGPVNAAVADEHTWVSFAGRAEVVEDQAKIDDLTDPASETFFEDDAEPVALRIVSDRIEWWASPSKAAQVIELVKAKVTSNEPDMGDSGTIDV